MNIETRRQRFAGLPSEVVAVLEKRDAEVCEMEARMAAEHAERSEELDQRIHRNREKLDNLMAKRAARNTRRIA